MEETFHQLSTETETNICIPCAKSLPHNGVSKACADSQQPSQNAVRYMPEDVIKQGLFPEAH